MELNCGEKRPRQRYSDTAAEHVAVFARQLMNSELRPLICASLNIRSSRDGTMMR